MRKPKIVVSECLYGTKCRYDGQGYNDKVIQSLKDYVDIQTVCPELAIGLSIPREPIRIEMNKENEEYRLIDYNSKNDYTNQMTEFSEEFINGLDDIDGFILKSRSPTCGLKDAKVYYCGNKCSIRSNENGFFSQKIIDKYDYLPIENEGRLKNYNIRDNFFTRIFFINNLKNLYEELERNYFLERISSLEEDTTIYDIFLLVDSNYNYLIELLKNKDIDISEINKLRLFVYNPYNYILNNILISEDKDISMLIMDRYNLFGFNLTKDKLDKDNIDNLIKELEIILNSIVMNKNRITDSRIKFIKDTNNI